jgi:hypothetical protein
LVRRSKINIHKIIENVGGLLPGIHSMASNAIRFDCGDISELPILGKFDPAPAPFPFVYIEFTDEIPGVPNIAFSAFVQQHETAGNITFRPFVGLSGDWRGFPGGALTVTKQAEKLCIEGNIDPDADAVVEHVALAILAIFTVMACSNVLFSDNPAPESLNKKRSKAGKVPLMSYKTLTLKIPNERIDSLPLGGTHASPRLHLRRGHIRRLSFDKAVWVQSSIVGSKHGFISKDYRVSK